jgi:hypothetical protein
MVRAGCMAVLFAAFVALGGCESTLSPIAVAPGCPDRPIRGPEQWASTPRTRLIDDFESGNDRLAVEEGRNGEWVLSTDPTAGASSAGASGRCAALGLFAGHFVAVSSADWGAMWVANFRAPVAGGGAQPYDASQYGGLSFWAGFDAANGAPFAVRVGLVTLDTAWNGGICGSYCMDFHGVDVVPGVAWQRSEIRFDALRQQGWGDVQTPLRRDQLVGFVVWPNRAANLWLDDLRFEP